MPDSDPAVFNPAAYGPEVARVLEMDGAGQRLMPLTCAECTNTPARQALLKTIGKTMDTARLFPEAKDPAAAAAGLWLYFSCFEEAHDLVAEPESTQSASCGTRFCIAASRIRATPPTGFKSGTIIPRFVPTARAARNS